eukprot:8540274-Alexandrium_andersonii.AAC.1
MSASLVGSEMCIRDRDSAPLQERGRPRTRAFHSGPPTAPQDCLGERARPCLLYTSDAADECSV